MSEEFDPTFKERMLPIVSVIAGSIVRVGGMALVAKGITDQHTIDQALPGAIEVLGGGLLYGASQVWQYFKSKKTVASEVKWQVIDQVQTQVLTQVKEQVQTQVAEQVPVAVKEELKNG